MTNDINELKLKRLKISNKILKHEKLALEDRICRLQKTNEAINESIKSANQNPYIKVLEGEIEVLKAELAKYRPTMTHVDTTVIDDVMMLLADAVANVVPVMVSVDYALRLVEYIDRTRKSEARTD